MSDSMSVNHAPCCYMNVKYRQSYLVVFNGLEFLILNTKIWKKNNSPGLAHAYGWTSVCAKFTRVS